MRIAELSSIADPDSFERALEEKGEHIVYTKRFADHHRFTQQEIIDAINGSIEAGAEALLTTEKDAVRFPRLERRDLPVLYMRVEIEMISGEEEFINWIERICFRSTRIAS